VLYESLCGRLPFAGDTETARALARLHQVPASPHEVAVDVPPGLSACVMRTLARSRDHRYTSMAELAAALDAEMRRAATQASVSPAPVPRTGSTTAAPANGATGELRPPRPRRADRRWLGTAVLVALIGGALLLIAALVRDTDRTGAGPPTTAPSQLSLIPITTVTPFDPEGEGRPGENDALAPLAHDGKAETAWRSERYQQQDFGVKSGLGLVVELDRAATLNRLDIDSESTGWNAQVYAYAGAAPIGPPAGTPIGTISNAPGDVSVDLGGVSARRVLVWFTRLGDAHGRYLVSVNEIRVIGTP
jgi:hypothetical protein